MPESRTGAVGWRRVRRRRVVAASLAVLGLALAGGGVALAAARSTPQRYVTAVAATGSVEQSVAAVGEVASVTRRDAAFAVAGTVATVDVTVGAAVTAGQPLATLDPASVQEALERAEAALADAQQQLEEDLDSQTASASTTAEERTPSGGTSSGGTAPSTAGGSSNPSPSAGPTPQPTSTPAPTPSSTPSPTPTGPSSAALDAAIAAVHDAQVALLDAIDAADTALATATASVAAAGPACEPVLALPSSTAETEADDDATAGAAALAACQAAITTALGDQQSAAAAQAELRGRSTTLDDAVTALRALVEVGSPTAGGDASAVVSPASLRGSVGTAANGDSSAPTSGTSEVASAADIVADRAAIAAAEVGVEVAQRDLMLATLTSPIAGTVAAVSLAPGDPVTAASTGAVVTIIAADGYLVTATVPLTQIGDVAVGQPAALTVASTDTGLTGAVSSVGVLDVSSTGDPEYAVTVAVDATQERLFDGSSAQVTITVDAIEGTLTVPTSAVHVDSSTTTVQVLRDGAPVDVEVEAGAVGATLTQIVSGLSAGDVVVLADRTRDVVGEDETSSDLTGLSDSDSRAPGSGPMPPGGQQGGPPGT